ncbi:MAG: hypothetical protein QF569_26830 [Candidatus Poribacteria bacterium]|nr:hypothetical protein [Candidatus Poribacteria bacterium]
MNHRNTDEIYAKVDQTGLIGVLKHLYELSKKGSYVNLNVVGPSGIGKTEIVKSFTKDLQGFCSVISPASFSEPGDVLGMSRQKDNLSVLCPPAWTVFPKDVRGPLVLMMDDFSRSTRIVLNCLLPILTERGNSSWALPKGVIIVLTSNPPQADYSLVNAFNDRAVDSRMISVELVPDFYQFLDWARRSQKDMRMLNWMKSRPEFFMIKNGEHSKQTSPRILTQWLDIVGPIPDWKSKAGLVRTLSAAVLPQIMVNAFMDFVFGIEEMHEVLMSPSEFFSADSFAIIAPVLLHQVSDQQGVQLDLLFTFVDKVLENITTVATVTESQSQKLIDLLKFDLIPADARIRFIEKIRSESQCHQLIRSVMSDNFLTDLILDGV